MVLGKLTDGTCSPKREFQEEISLLLKWEMGKEWVCASPLSREHCQSQVVNLTDKDHSPQNERKRKGKEERHVGSVRLLITVHGRKPYLLWSNPLYCFLVGKTTGKVTYDLILELRPPWKAQKGSLSMCHRLSSLQCCLGLPVISAVGLCLMIYRWRQGLHVLCLCSIYRHLFFSFGW